MLRSALLVILFVFSASVCAEGLSYNAITGSYGQIDVDDFDADGDIFGIGVSAEVGESFFLFADYSVSEVDNAVLSVDIDEWSAGIGHHMPMSDDVDLVTSVSYVYADVTLSSPLLGSGSGDDNGFGLGVGIRYAANEEFEINAGVSYADIGDFGDGTSFGAGFLYNFTENFAVGVAGNWGDDVTAYNIGARFYFDN